MEVFAYRAVNSSGEFVEAELATDGVDSARELIAERGLTLIELKARRSASVRARRETESEETVIEFTRSMGNLLRAGVSLLQILEDLEVEAEKRKWRNRLRDLRLRIEGGSTVSEALAAHPGIFSEIYVSLVQAGEESGQLPEIFSKLAEHLEWRRTLRQQVCQALSYPAIVLGGMGLLIGLLTFFVFPRLGAVFAALDVTLPLPTRILLGVGQFGSRAWPYFLGCFLPLVLAAGRLRHHPRVKRFLDRVLLRVPVAGHVVSMVAFSRLSGSLATLLSSGVQLDRALQLAQHAVGNSVIAKAVQRTRGRIQGGETLAEALGNTGGFPHLLIRLVRVGESSGDLVGMLQNCNEYYERELPRAIGRALSAAAPMLVVLMGFMVVWAALSIFLPLLQMGSAIR